MIVGTGMMARAFEPIAAGRPDIVVHVAGVSNSQCTDPRQFEREGRMLRQTLSAAGEGTKCLVYCSTCSVFDPTLASAPYIRHKLAMEELVRGHARHLILRLPHVAGHSSNPHTLLNYLYARIAGGERFALWANARRNIIDCRDVCALTAALIDDGASGETVNIACSHDHSVLEIVKTIERVVRGLAVYDVVERGGAYPIDIDRIRPLLHAARVSFDADYLERVVATYYGPR